MTNLKPYTLHVGDALTVLKTLPSESVNCCVTSPPYFGLRSYLDADDPDKAFEVGAETTPAAFVSALVAVFEEVRHVLTADGTCWLNLGDSYSGNGNRSGEGLPPKNLMMIPARVAIALQDAGWILRAEIVWSKPSCMPESVTDRVTRSHEMIYMLTKSERYFYDGEAIREPAQNWGPRDRTNWKARRTPGKSPCHGGERGDFAESGRNARHGGEN